MLKKRQINKQIKEWEKKKADAKPKSLEHGIADNVIQKLRTVLIDKLDEDGVKSQIARLEAYKEQCLQSHEIKQKQIHDALIYNDNVKHKDRMIVPSMDEEWPIEQIPETCIEELEKVIA